MTTKHLSGTLALTVFIVGLIILWYFEKNGSFSASSSAPFTSTASAELMPQSYNANNGAYVPPQNGFSTALNYLLQNTFVPLFGFLGMSNTFTGGLYTAANVNSGSTTQYIRG